MSTTQLMWSFLSYASLSSACNSLFVFSNFKIHLCDVIIIWFSLRLYVYNYVRFNSFTSFPWQEPTLLGLGASTKFSAIVRFFLPLLYHNWCSFNQPEDYQLLFGNVPVSYCIYFSGTHIPKQWISLPNCHFGCRQQRKGNQLSLSCHLKT